MIKIISGGQTGIDRMGLEVAKELGLQTGGTVPKGYWTENGQDYSLKEFNVVEAESSSYNVRTCLNIRNSDATILFGNINSPGTKYTLRVLKEDDKPFIMNPTIDGLVEFIKENNFKILNIAGNRGSKISEYDLNYYRNILKLGLIKSGERIEVNE